MQPTITEQDMLMEADFPVWLNIVVGFFFLSITQALVVIFNEDANVTKWFTEGSSRPWTVMCFYKKQELQIKSILFSTYVIFYMYVIQGLKLNFGSTCHLGKWYSGCTRPDTFSLTKYTLPSP